MQRRQHDDEVEACCYDHEVLEARARPRPAHRHPGRRVSQPAGRRGRSQDGRLDPGSCDWGGARSPRVVKFSVPSHKGPLQLKVREDGGCHRHSACAAANIVSSDMALPPREVFNFAPHAGEVEVACLGLAWRSPEWAQRAIVSTTRKAE
mmetsp:Transcript_30532/g.88100  ORF Transcript_30532/g.88100 Transcript_30532/m.88100 type:complete len:150 (+) Transcript_30532:1102-1551(+)